MTGIWPPVTEDLRSVSSLEMNLIRDRQYSFLQLMRRAQGILSSISVAVNVWTLMDVQCLSHNSAHKRRPVI